MTNQECNGCGSSLEQRQKRRDELPLEDISTGIGSCPHCGSDKCIICDIGDDVECGNCEL